ncbi:membrane protein [Rhodopirellula maiorica SM1]|uniref:Membrane protein n=1 Tax=Rhodopirellula maiorica SM1 TaxID=1265738 RepID=M5RNX8_9BACT|nr:membrane protein [Rhodopirellula maiorica SM1]
MPLKCSQCGMTMHVSDAKQCLLCGEPLLITPSDPRNNSELPARESPPSSSMSCVQCGMKTHSKGATKCLLCGEPFPIPLVASRRFYDERSTNQGTGQQVVANRYSGSPRLLKPRRLIAVFTALHGVAGLLGGAALLSMVFLDVVSTLNVLTVALLITVFIARGMCGAVGAILLWKGARLGYQLSVVCWLYLVTVGLAAVVQMPYLEFSDPTMARHIGSTFGKLLFGIPFLYVLVSDLFSKRGAGDPGNGFRT